MRKLQEELKGLKEFVVDLNIYNEEGNLGVYFKDLKDFLSLLPLSYVEDYLVTDRNEFIILQLYFYNGESKIYRLLRMKNVSKDALIEIIKVRSYIFNYTQDCLIKYRAKNLKRVKKNNLIAFIIESNLLRNI